MVVGVASVDGVELVDGVGSDARTRSLSEGWAIPNREDVLDFGRLSGFGSFTGEEFGCEEVLLAICALGVLQVFGGTYWTNGP